MYNKKNSYDMIYFYIALFCTGVFLVQFVLSFFLGDLDIDSDIDIDGDGSSYFSMSDLLSFKGLIHFGIGFSWTMWFNQGMDNKLLAAGISIFVGLVFVVVLYLVYALAMELECISKTESGTDLVGRNVTIYLNLGNGIYSGYVIKDNAKQLIKVHSDKEFNTGDETVIKKFESGIYYI